MKNFIKKLFGLDKIEKSIADAEMTLSAITARTAQAIEETKKAEQEAKQAQEAEAEAKMTPKERATAKGEPWVAVLDTHVNKDNIKNGFFELDWNEHFIVQLKQAGYGFEGDPEEEIVDRWFRELAYNMLAEAGVAEPERVTGGFINVTKLAGGKASVE